MLGQSLGADHPDVAKTLNDMAIVYKKQQKYEEALKTYHESLRIKEDKLGVDDPEVASLLPPTPAAYTRTRTRTRTRTYTRACTCTCTRACAWACTCAWACACTYR